MTDTIPPIDWDMIDLHKCGEVTLRDPKTGTAIAQVYGPDQMAQIIAEANYALPDDDVRKITHSHVWWLREEADVLKRNGAGAGSLMCAEIADILASYLPPMHTIAYWEGSTPIADALAALPPRET